MTKLPYHLTSLKYFFDTVKTGSFGESAKLNHVSQSAISQAVTKLEQVLECRLFSHQPGICKVTEKGQELYEKSQELFQHIERIENHILNQQTGSINFACTHSFAIACLPRHLKLAKQHYPQIKISFRLGHYYEIKDWLKKGIIDFGILLDNDDLSLFDSLKVYQGYFQTYISKKHKDPKSLSFLLDNEERRESNILKENFKRKYKNDLPVLMEISSWKVIADLTEAGLGIGLFPDYLANENKGLKIVYPELMRVPYAIYAVFKRNKPKNPSALLFCDLLTNKSPT